VLRELTFRLATASSVCSRLDSVTDISAVASRSPISTKTRDHCCRKAESSAEKLFCESRLALRIPLRSRRGEVAPEWPIELIRTGLLARISPKNSEAPHKRT